MLLHAIAALISLDAYPADVDRVPCDAHASSDIYDVATLRAPGSYFPLDAFGPSECDHLTGQLLTLGEPPLVAPEGTTAIRILWNMSFRYTYSFTALVEDEGDGAITWRLAPPMGYPAATLISGDGRSLTTTQSQRLSTALSAAQICHRADDASLWVADGDHLHIEAINDDTYCIHTEISPTAGGPLRNLLQTVIDLSGANLDDSIPTP